MDLSQRLTGLAHRLRTPGYRRSVLLRRALAAALVCAAGLSALLNASRADPLVVTFARPVAAGARVTDEDLQLQRVPERVVPEGALREQSLASGHILAAGAAPGEVVTSTRLVGPDLVSELIAAEPEGEPFTMVPVALAEPDILPMLHHGAVVDVIAEGPTTVASGGRIVTVGEEGTVLVLMRRSQASAVAAASLSMPLAVVLASAGTPA